MKITRLKILYYIFIIIFLSIGSIIGIRDINRYVDQLIKEYPMIKNEDSLKGIIIDFSSYKGCPNIILKDSTKIGLDWARNYYYEPHSLDKFLSIGDSIVKKSKSDTLFIYRNDKKYFFVLLQVIRKN